MFFSIANFKRLSWVVPPVLLAVAVGALRPLEARLLPEGPGRARVLAGGGGSLGMLGGMRSVLAGGCWLRTNLAWERRDAAGVMAQLHLTVAADERPLTFWLNGARMIAYDLPEWGLEEAPAAVRQRERVRHAGLAIAFLQRGIEARGESAEFYVEMANIRLRVLGDREGAAQWFRQAAEQRGAPYYAARIHGELLRELGRPAEALAWLRQILPGLPPADPAAQRGVVLVRIKGLEQELGGK